MAAPTQHASMDAVTISTTEISMISGTSTLQNDTTPGTYCLVIDPANFAKGDIFEVKIKDKTRGSGGTQQVVAQFYVKNAQTQSVVYLTIPLLHGWDMTIKRTAGSDRAVTSSIRKVA